MGIFFEIRLGLAWLMLVVDKREGANRGRYLGGSGLSAVMGIVLVRSGERA